MDYKKTNAPLNTVTRDMMDLCKDTGNVYETVSIIAKRANQIAGEMKHDLDKKLQESLRSMITLRRFRRTVSRLKSHAIMRSSRSLR